MNDQTTPWDGREPPGESFPATSRLLRRSEFKKVQERGLRYAGAALVLLALPTSLGRRRLGVTVSRKIGHAVCRAQIKRLLRDIFRKERGSMPPSMDLVAIARSKAAGATREILLAEFMRGAAFFRRTFEK